MPIFAPAAFASSIDMEGEPAKLRMGPTEPFGSLPVFANSFAFFIDSANCFPAAMSEGFAFVVVGTVLMFDKGLSLGLVFLTAMSFVLPISAAVTPYCA